MRLQYHEGEFSVAEVGELAIAGGGEVAVS